jgi:twitching motility two-component system response regulator PilG
VGTRSCSPTTVFDALAKINDYQPDLVFCDILMPRLDGYQTCAIIKTQTSASPTFRW